MRVLNAGNARRQCVLVADSQVFHSLLCEKERDKFEKSLVSARLIACPDESSA